MKRTILPLLCLALLATTPARAVLISGKHLRDYCGEKQPARMDLGAGLCDGYIWGVNDTLQQLRLSRSNQGLPVPHGACVPADVGGPQLRTAVTRYLDANPDNLHFNAAGLVMLALEAEWPCPK